MTDSAKYRTPRRSPGSAASEGLAAYQLAYREKAIATSGKLREPRHPALGSI
jgi:hypothetical protein